MEELVSVIVIVRNEEEYINECLTSIIKQTHENMEILIINEGSNDHTMKICDYYKKQDKRIKIFDLPEDENAKNFGISKAKGNYIAFVYGSDRISKGYISYLYKHLIREDADIMCVASYDNKKYSKGSLGYNIYKDEEIMENYLHMNLKSACYGKLYKKSLFKNIKYPTNTYFDDAKTTFRLFDASKKVVMSNINMYAVVNRYNYSSLKDTKKMDKIKACLELLDFIEKNYPDLTDYCKTKVCYEAIDLFRKVEGEKYKKQLFNYVKVYRKYALKDKRFNFQKKLLCIRSIFGYHMMKLSFFLEKNSNI